MWVVWLQGIFELGRFKRIKYHDNASDGGVFTHDFSKHGE